MSAGRTFKFLVVGCFLAVALVAAGCGGDDESSTTETSTEALAEVWAGSVCSALTTWKSDLETAADPLTDLSSLSEESVRQAADDAKSATDTLTDSLRNLGRPDIASGEQVESSLDDVATEVENGANEVEAAVEGISSIVDIPSAVGTITTTVADMTAEINNAVQTLEDADASGELKNAFDDAGSCDELTGSSG